LTQGTIGFGVNDLKVALTPSEECNDNEKACQGKDLHKAVDHLFKSWSKINLPKQATAWNTNSKAVWQDTDKLRKKSLEMLQRLLKAHYYLSLQAQGFELEPKGSDSNRSFEPILSNDTFYSNYYQSPVMRLKRMGEYFWQRMKRQVEGTEDMANIGESQTRDTRGVAALDSAAGATSRDGNLPYTSKRKVSRNAAKVGKKT